MLRFLQPLLASIGRRVLSRLRTLTKAGQYEVRLAYSHASSRATNVPIEILHLDGEFSGKINQRDEPPIDHRFVSLGKFRFDESGQWYVIISNEETDGHVTVDAIQLLPVDASAGKTAKTPGTPAASVNIRGLTPPARQEEPVDLCL